MTFYIATLTFVAVALFPHFSFQFFHIVFVFCCCFNNCLSFFFSCVSSSFLFTILLLFVVIFILFALKSMDFYSLSFCLKFFYLIIVIWYLLCLYFMQCIIHFLLYFIYLSLTHTICNFPVKRKCAL